VGGEVPLVRAQLVPVFLVVAEVHLLGCARGAAGGAGVRRRQRRRKRSNAAPVQNDASAFLYISHTSGSARPRVSRRGSCGGAVGAPSLRPPERAARPQHRRTVRTLYREHGESVRVGVQQGLRQQARALLPSTRRQVALVSHRSGHSHTAQHATEPQPDEGTTQTEELRRRAGEREPFQTIATLPFDVPATCVRGGGDRGRGSVAPSRLGAGPGTVCPSWSRGVGLSSCAPRSPT
jgi:hypothetical protein